MPKSLIPLLVPMVIAVFLTPHLAAQVDFNRDVRPILSDRCFTCHGPDETKRLSGLRLDIEDGAKKNLGGRFAIVPGDPAESILIQRVMSDDSARRMPPAYAGHAKLSDTDIGVLTRWIQQGARWQGHWAFASPTRPATPRVSKPAWPKNPIDNFIMQGLDQEGLLPSPEAEKHILIRRVSFDLTGLPPTPDEIRAFVGDDSPDAYEKVVDRLLASPAYGERMAMRWLDAARYADTNGYQTDAERSMWRWRDWVIEAFNSNMPYDQFTIEQLAGDLLPNPTPEQVIATGFNRNHRANGEGGIIAGEYAVEYVVDRVETTSTVWLGLTLGCARCHNHKYDPLTQKEFYQFFAFFNQVPESGTAFKYGNSPPLVPAPTKEDKARLAALDAKLSAAEQHLATLGLQIQREQKNWEGSLIGADRIDWAPSAGLSVRVSLDGDLSADVKPETPMSWRYRLVEGIRSISRPAAGTIPSVEPRWVDGQESFSYGLGAGRAAAFDGRRYIEVGDAADFGLFDPFTVSAWIHPMASTGAILSRAKDEAQGRGWTLSLHEGRLYASVIESSLYDGVRIESEETVPLNQWSHVALTVDGSREAKNMKVYLNGKPLEMTVHLDYMNQPFSEKEPLRIGAGQGTRFEGRIAQVRIYRSELKPDEIAVLSSANSLNELAGMASGERNAAQAAKLRWAFLDAYASPEARQASTDELSLRREREWMINEFPTVMVMQDDDTPHPTHVLRRGVYDQPGEVVTAGVPAVLPGLPSGGKKDRLALARWLVAPENPLTSRVTVNRFWQMYFGAGLVKTTEDFGSQGEAPSHPALLDWLAAEFIRTGWDVKKLQRTIVMSAGYRQSSRMTTELRERDPDNRMLARGPRLRLAAEMVRDQSLAASGLLVDAIGGPSAKPYQPPGLWSELTGRADYEPDTGDGLYRRSLYTFWKRTSPPPMMTNFDAPARESCVVRAVRTNTPLQSLNLMNDVTYLEAARKMAERMMREGGVSPEQRLSFGFQLATAREPSSEAAEILASSLNYYRDLYRSAPDAAVNYLSQGASARDESLAPDELAAYAAVASLILNLDAAVTKE